MNGEIELKLELDPKSVALTKRLPLLAAAPRQQAKQLSIYYDTAKGALRKHGYSLRVRDTGGGFVQTVKSIREDAGLFSREEWEFPVDSIEPDLARLRGLPLEPLARSGKLKKLGPVVRTDVSRTSWRIEEGQSAIQIDLDEGEIEAEEHIQPICELELELLSGEAGELLRIARGIAGQVPVRIGVLSKAERGFALATGKLHKVHKAGTVAVEEDMTIAEAFTVIANDCLQHYRLNEPLVIARRDSEALHQARVALRRLRSAFALFRPILRDDDYERLRLELRWFTAQLGDARNLDVYLERQLPDEERGSLTGMREQTYDRVIEAMNSQRQRDLMLDLVGWIALGDWRSGKPARRPIAPYAEKRLERLWATITAPAADIAAMDEVDRHALRIQVKKMRYAVEFLSGVFPDEADKQKRFAADVEDLQEELGKLNDLVTARELAMADSSAQTEEEVEAEHLAEAEHHARDLIALGPFWRRERIREWGGWLLRAVDRTKARSAPRHASRRR